MKITDQLVTVLNVGLQDIFFEVGLLSRLMDFPTDEDLDNFLAQKFDKVKVLKSNPTTGATEEVEEDSEEEKSQTSLRNSLNTVKVKNADELIQMMNKRYKTNLKNPSDAVKFAQATRNDVADLVQIDRVLEGLNRFGLTKKGRKEIESIRNKELTRICDLILVKVDKSNG